MSETTAVTEASEPRVYRLTRAELDATAEKVAKLNERAAKKGLNGELTLTFERVEIEDVVAGGIPVTKIFWDTQLHGRAPSFNGWSFIATLDWDAAAGLITRTVPGFEGLVDRSALRANWCDYCNTDRQRNETYLLVNTETGERTQVGSTCIKDFLGQQVSPVQFFDAASSVESDLGGYGGGERDYDYTPLSVLAVAWAVIQEFGFVRSTDDFGGSVPTKYTVATVLYPPSKGKEREDALALIRKLQPHIEKAAGQAKRIQDFILSEKFAGESEYVVNLKAITAAERVGYRHLGILVSAPQAWARETERDLRRQAEKAELVNEFFGAEKDKVELTVAVKSIRFIDGQYGTTTLYTLVVTGPEHNSHLVKWFSSSAALGKDVTTQTFRIKATIKGFDTYNEVRSTVITRAKVLEVIEAAA